MSGMDVVERNSLINMILGGIMSCMLALTEQLTKFATLRCFSLLLVLSGASAGAG